MNLAQGIEAIDIALYLKKYKVLVLADFHLGYEEALHNKGVFVPKQQYKKTIDRLEQIFAAIKKKKYDVRTIVINGDLKHEFGRISRQEWKEVMLLLAYLERKCSKIVLVKGNHDTALGPIANKRNIAIIDAAVFGSILVAHGHKTADSARIRKLNPKTVIIGHEHPAVSLHEKAKTERFKCFLKGKCMGKTVIVQPSFNLTKEGADILKEKRLSPYLKHSLSNFEVFIVDDKKVLWFGKLKDIAKACTPQEK